MKQKYIDHKFNAASLALIGLVNGIVIEYADQGFDLTLRQLYYQLVARDHIPNTQRSYKRIGNVVRNGRLAGLIDWAAIVDRTRTLRQRSHWADPQEIIRSAERSYHIDMWEHQNCRPEVWIEKDALAGVISGVCNELDTPYFACRGYVSLSEMYGAARRVRRHNTTHYPVVFHLGDHDPSGIDMTRDMSDRLELLAWSTEGENFGFDRLALNMDQVEEYGPPPNPTKLTDSRAGGYVALHGYDSWELDALEPRVIVELIRSNIDKLIDKEQWAKDDSRKVQSKMELRSLYENYEEALAAAG
jgi:hypothetical protein